MKTSNLILLGLALGAGFVWLKSQKRPNGAYDANGNLFPEGTPDTGPGNPWWQAEHPWMQPYYGQNP